MFVDPVTWYYCMLGITTLTDFRKRKKNFLSYLHLQVFDFRLKIIQMPCNQKTAARK